MTIDDESPEAVKILQGYEYTIDRSNILTVSDSKTQFDYASHKDKLDKGTINPQETLDLLKFLISKIDIMY